MSIGEWATPVRMIGLLSYAAAAAACLFVWRKGGPSSRLAAVLASVEIFLFFDMALNLRWRLHDLLERLSVSQNAYEQRHGPQVLVLLVLALAGTAAAVWAARAFRERPWATLAVWGALISAGCWLSEVVSLHAVDALYYRRLGPLMWVCLLWMGGAAMTVAGVLLEAA